MTTKSIPQNWRLGIATAEGIFVAVYSERGLCSLSFPGGGKPVLAKGPDTSVPASVEGWHRLTTRALKAVLEGKEATELPPIDVSTGTKFQQSVWRALMKIRRGSTKSYAQIAADVGSPRAFRAVGGACGANRIPVLIPCHRVLASGHRLGGFSGGLDWKQKLLSREGVSC